jgi:hypothetical protein
MPAGTNLLTLQAEFVAVLHPWFKPLYFAGAFLAVLGTLYGTIEVAPTVLGEMARAFRPDAAERNKSRLRLLSIGWVGMGGLCILVWSLLHHSRAGSDKPPGLIAILTPANLFTGVLGCGVICLLNVWMDRRFLPKTLCPPQTVLFLGLLAGLLFLTLGLRGYWDHSGWVAYGILAGTIALSWLVAWSVQRGTKGEHEQE